MTKFFLVAAASVTLFAASARPAYAAPVEVGDLVQFRSSLGTLGGGAFVVDNLSDASVPDFITFCIQYSQHINYSSPFRVGSITNYADDAGGPDPIATETAWIMSNYSRGLLTAYSVDDLQWAIWRLEGERTGSWGAAQAVINLATTAVAGGWANDGVDVVNLFWANGTPAQDQLVYTPKPPGDVHSVPEPGTLMLLGSGIALGIAARRRRKSARRD
jgi:hypothetical protein